MGKEIGKWGVGLRQGHSLSRASMSSPGLSTGAFKKYKSLWQPDWGRQRKRSRSYIQVCMWHMALALTQHPGPIRPRGGREVLTL